LEQQQKTDKLSQNMKERTTEDELKEKGILSNKDIAPSLQATAKELEKQQKTDKLQKGLRERSESKDLADQGILQNTNVAGSLQATATKLEKQQKSDKLKQALNQQSTQQELQEKGIMYNNNLASSLQPNANILEMQLKKLQQFSKSSVVQTKILQKVSRQQKKKIDRLQDIIKQKDEQVALMKDIGDKQMKLIHNLHDDKEEDDDYFDDTKDNEIMDGDIKRLFGVLKNLSNEVSNFEVNYTQLRVDEIGNIDLEELVNPNSVFNSKLDKYYEVITAINTCSSAFKKSIIDLRNYVKNKYIPNPKEYINWDLEEIILWIKSLENGRYIKYLDKLRNGFTESEIIRGEELPDLTTADLSVTPFNIKIFRDKRDLIKNFKALRDGTKKQNDDYNQEKDNKDYAIKSPGSPLPSLRLHGTATNNVVHSILRRSNIEKEIEAMRKSIDIYKEDDNYAQNDNDNDENDKVVVIKQEVNEQYVD